MLQKKEKKLFQNKAGKMQFYFKSWSYLQKNVEKLSVLCWKDSAAGNFTSAIIHYMVAISWNWLAKSSKLSWLPDMSTFRSCDLTLL